MTARASDIRPTQRAEIVVRDGGRCVRGGDLIQGYDYSVQHRVARGMGGSRHAARACALILLCGSATTGCHGWVEAHPAEARELGYRVPAGTDPAMWPVLFHGQDWCLLTDDGWVPLRAPEEVTNG